MTEQINEKSGILKSGNFFQPFKVTQKVYKDFELINKIRKNST